MSLHVLQLLNSWITAVTQYHLLISKEVHHVWKLRIKTVSAPNSVAPQGSAPRAQSSEPVEKKTPVVNVVSHIEAEDIIDDAQMMANDCYIAYLMKTNDFWQSANRQTLNQLCDLNHIMKLDGKYKVEVLKQCSTGYDKKLHSYSKSLMTK